ncbi:TPA: secretion protein F [Clostridioides difficile]|nr:secretion protein F [Clostridioides difficile]
MIFIIIILISFGVYKILEGSLKLPSRVYSRALSQVLKINRKSQSLDDFVRDWAIKLSKFIKLNNYRREIMKSTLKSANIKLSPESYIASSIIKALIVFLVSIIPIAMIFPKLKALCLILSIYYFYTEITKANRIIKTKKMIIEYELPEFVYSITQELKCSRDVVSIIKNYKESANEEFRQELEITLADMTSGSYVEALRRFDSRIGIQSLTEIVRGLIGVITGNDEVIYFQTLGYKLEKFRYQKLEELIEKEAKEFDKYIGYMGLSFFICIFGVLGINLVDSLKTMF